MLSLSLPALGRAITLLCSLTAVLPATAGPVTNPFPDAISSPPGITPRAVVSWTSRYRLTTAQYQSASDSLVSTGYRLTAVSGYTTSPAYTDTRYAAIWEKSVPYPWVTRQGLTAAQLQSVSASYAAQGYRPRHVAGYAVGSAAQFAAIWDKSPAPGDGFWVARQGQTSAEYQAECNKWAAQGMRLMHVSGYAEAGVAKFAALWERPADQYDRIAKHGMTARQLADEVTLRHKAMYRPVLVSGYVVGNTEYYAAIWDRSHYIAWVLRYGLSSAQYQAESDNWVGQGFRLAVVSAYTVGATGDRYAAIWSKT